jgi:hypothetical protein
MNLALVFCSNVSKQLSFLSFILLVISLFLPETIAQYDQIPVTGTIESVPSMAHPKSKITLKSLYDGAKYTTTTDSIGRFILKVPWDSYERKVETINNFLFIDTVKVWTVVTNNNYQLQTIADDTVTSTYFSSLRDEIAGMTGTFTNNPETIIGWSKENLLNLPIFFRPYDPSDYYSMPNNPDWALSLDSNMNYINSLFPDKLHLNKINSGEDSLHNINYRWYYPIPGGGYAWTSTGPPGNIIGYSRISMNKPGLSNEKITPTNLRELWRSFGFVTFSQDPSMVSYLHGNGNYQFHPDEIKVMKVVFSLKLGTNLFPHKNTVVKNIYWPPEKISSIPDTKIQEDSKNNIVAVLNNVFRNPNSNGTLSYTWTPSSNLNFNLHSDTLFVSPIAAYYGTDEVIITATDTSNQTTSDTVAITTQKTNFAPSASRLLNPANNDTLNSDTTTFRYTSSIDINNEPIIYLLHIFGNGTDTTFTTIDTIFTKNNMRINFGEGKTYRWTISINNEFFTTASPDTFKFTTQIITGINEKRNEIPTAYMLNQNFPNPFNPSTTINYSLPKAGNVKLTVYNSLGSKVATLVNEYKSLGNYSVQFYGSNLASGIYLYRLESGNYSATKKFIMLK